MVLKNIHSYVLSSLFISFKVKILDPQYKMIHILPERNQQLSLFINAAHLKASAVLRTFSSKFVGEIPWKSNKMSVVIGPSYAVGLGCRDTAKTLWQQCRELLQETGESIFMSETSVMSGISSTNKHLRLVGLICCRNDGKPTENGPNVRSTDSPVPRYVMTHIYFLHILLDPSKSYA